jgi:hypothetical protein
MEEDERTIRWFGRFESEHFFFIVASLFLIVLASIHIVHFLVNAVLRATRKQHRVIYQFEGTVVSSHVQIPYRIKYSQVFGREFLRQLSA